MILLKNLRVADSPVPKSLESWWLMALEYLERIFALGLVNSFSGPDEVT